MVKDEIKELKKEFKKLDKRLKKFEDYFYSRFSETKFRKVKVENPDKLLDKALAIIQYYDHASASLLQRRLAIGYARAAQIIDQLEERGFVKPAIGSTPRKVIHKEK